MTYYRTSSYQEYEVLWLDLEFTEQVLKHDYQMLEIKDILIIITLVILLYKLWWYVLWPWGVVQAPQAKWSGWFVLWGVSQPLRFFLEIDDNTYSVQTKQSHSPTGLVLFDCLFKISRGCPSLWWSSFTSFFPGNLPVDSEQTVPPSSTSKLPIKSMVPQCCCRKPELSGCEAAKLNSSSKSFQIRPFPK